jgi:hypothetical protein
MDKEENEQKENHHFTVVMRGPSAVCFKQNDFLQVNDFPSSAGPVKLIYRTRWIQKGHDIFIPGHLWIEISGNCNSLNDALVPFANAGLSMLPIMSLSTNAAIREPELELGFDSTKDINERDFFQAYVAPETSELFIPRHINVKLTNAIISSLIDHAESERLRRAINQYRIALDQWRLGRDLMSLAHLWMAIEALTKAKIRIECSLRNIQNEQALADTFKIPIKNLDSYIRKELLLKGDSECYAKAKKASDGFEHGFLKYDDLHGLAQDVRHRMACYTRQAILEMCQLEADVFNMLVNNPYDKPIGNWPVVKYLKGKLIGENNDLALPKNQYPFMSWKSTINKTFFDDKGKYNATISDTFTEELSEGTSFQDVRYEAWPAG